MMPEETRAYAIPLEGRQFTPEPGIASEELNKSSSGFVLMGQGVVVAGFLLLRQDLPEFIDAKWVIF